VITIFWPFSTIFSDKIGDFQQFSAKKLAIFNNFLQKIGDFQQFLAKKLATFNNFQRKKWRFSFKTNAFNNFSDLIAVF
jgi:hypothetical protein